MFLKNFKSKPTNIFNKTTYNLNLNFDDLDDENEIDVDIDFPRKYTHILLRLIAMMIIKSSY